MSVLCFAPRRCLAQAAFQRGKGGPSPPRGRRGQGGRSGRQVWRQLRRLSHIAHDGKQQQQDHHGDQGHDGHRDENHEIGLLVIRITPRIKNTVSMNNLPSQTDLSVYVRVYGFRPVHPRPAGSGFPNENDVGSASPLPLRIQISQFRTRDFINATSVPNRFFSCWHGSCIYNPSCVVSPVHGNPEGNGVFPPRQTIWARASASWSPTGRQTVGR